MSSGVGLLLGDASYSLYLFHPLLMQPTVKTLARVSLGAHPLSPLVAAALAEP